MITSRRTGLILAATAVSMLAAAAPIAWSATPHQHPAQHEQPAPPRFSLSWTADYTMHDLAPAGPSSGDTVQAHFRLTGKSTGTADFACTAVAANYLCQGVIRLRDGDLYAQTGPIDESQPAAIVGGTRAYDGARGQFTQVELSERTGTWTIMLRR